MIAFVLRRLLQAILVMVTVSLMAFFMVTYVGDPVHNMVGEETTLEERNKLREDLGLNDPVVVQFGRFLVNAMQGEFGFSFRNQQRVSQLIVDRLPATLEMTS